MTTVRHAAWYCGPGDDGPIAGVPAGVVAMIRGLAVSLAALLIAGYALADDTRDADFLADVMNLRLETHRSGVDSAWANPFTGSKGVITILDVDDSDPDRPCRNYVRTTERPGEPTIVVEGRACRIEDGLWQRNETQMSTLTATGTGSAPLESARAVPPEPPPQIPPPAHKPDPNVFFASVPTPSVY